MMGPTEDGGVQGGSRWRIAAWSAAGLVLLLPAVAMQFTDEVAWDLADFAVLGALLLGAGLTYELAAQVTADTTYRAAVGLALATAFLLVWGSLGVGIIGKDGDPANLMYAGVLAVGIVGALAARGRPRGMAHVLLVVALAQALAAGIALLARLGYPWSGPLELVGVNGFFIALWLTSAWLFTVAARRRTRNDA
jgi:hypothetical protein